MYDRDNLGAASMKRARGFDQKLSMTWLIVFMFLVWQGHFFVAACLGGLPWMMHRRLERNLGKTKR
jgi:hypothetical protein